jgi:hypothetical protein
MQELDEVFLFNGLFEKIVVATLMAFRRMPSIFRAVTGEQRRL